MIENLLIANRGEIARRIIRTAKRLGVRTIAIYSDADSSMPFVKEADTAIHIGPSSALESYLNIERVLSAAQRSGATAVHPGYGFLSENAEFADRVVAAGLVWVGPPAAAIRAMGLKDAAKKMMRDAGVRVTPGYLGEDQSAERLQSEADAIGYPVMIKAVAGGGGKGMRSVDARSSFPEALASCKREAFAAFRDDRVLLEKSIATPRHIEVQIFGDSYGNLVHMFERDCSLQRRHQKVVEEAPAPGITESVREALTRMALDAARAINYVGAGTVEFIADATDGLKIDRIWFMEMNTRLQVEHPVTEAIVGEDLVEWQLRIASGEALPKSQAELTINGWAMEGRLYAENPTADFVPTVGTLAHLVFPSGPRIDSGFEQGDTVSPYYNSMLAKLIVHADTREEAALRLSAAFSAVEVWPVSTNAGLLARIAAHPEFVCGNVFTRFIDVNAERLIPPERPEASTIAAAAAGLLPQQKDNPWLALHRFRLGDHGDNKIAVEIGGKVYRAEPIQGGKIADLGLDGMILFQRGQAWPFSEPRLRKMGHSAIEDGTILAPMPGVVTLVEVQEGSNVRRGTRLMILEAMKMEYSLAAPFDGVVTRLAVKLGDQVGHGAFLAHLEKGESDGWAHI